MNGLERKMSYFVNPGLKKHTERVFEGIESGRTKALYNWFNDTWSSMDLIIGKIITSKKEEEFLNILKESKKLYDVFSELFVVNSSKMVVTSTYQAFIRKALKTEYTDVFNGQKKYMYGPYSDPDTLTVGESKSAFFDEVTLMFIAPLTYKNQRYYLCGRVPNDVMSDILQDEDSHIYKESGDNYLFMVKTKRNIQQGTAISRSRFEDNTFTLGDNLKEGIKTKGYGMVQIEKHTEFEIVFNNPKSQCLHEGVQKTIDNGSNLEAWPGYPEYRHILVGGKGILIDPPHSDEQWGLLCEGDIDEIYLYRSIRFKLTRILGIVNALLIFAAHFLYQTDKWVNIGVSILLWFTITLMSILVFSGVTLNPLSKTTALLKDIAEGEGDLTKRVFIKSNDDMGELSRWFNKFVNNQMHIVKRIRSATGISNTAVEELHDMTEDINESKGNIAITIDQLIKTMRDYTDELKQMKEQLNTISDAFHVIVSVMSEAGENMLQTNNKAVESQSLSEAARHIMEEIVVDVNETLKGMVQLETHSNDINSIIDVINNISSQTKLLALNASIEAARAGEHGVGFAVVASEISKLAELTTESTTEINTSITGIQTEIEKNKKNMTYIDERIKEGNEQVSRSIGSFGSIQQNIVSITTEFEKLSSQMEEKLITLNQISESVNMAVEGFETSASANEKDVSLVLEALTANINNIEQIKNSLEYTSSYLFEMINAFKIEN